MKKERMQEKVEEKKVIFSLLLLHLLVVVVDVGWRIFSGRLTTFCHEYGRGAAVIRPNAVVNVLII